MVFVVIITRSYEILLDSNGTKSIEKDYLNTLNRVQKKIQILEDRTFFTDSLYFEILNDMVRIENKISSLILSFKEMNNLDQSLIFLDQGLSISDDSKQIEGIILTKANYYRKKQFY